MRLGWESVQVSVRRGSIHGLQAGVGSVSGDCLWTLWGVYVFSVECKHHYMEVIGRFFAFSYSLSLRMFVYRISKEWLVNPQMNEPCLQETLVPL